LPPTHKYTLLLKNIKIDCQIVNVALFVLLLGQSAPLADAKAKVFWEIFLFQHQKRKFNIPEY